MIKQKLKESLLRKIILPVNSMQSTQSKYGKTVSTKSVSVKNKDITITLEATNQVTSPDTSTILLAVDYNIFDDMKKVHVNISMFELTKIMSEWDMLLHALG